jgi:Flp pilus assembly pilin Flp
MRLKSMGLFVMSAFQALRHSEGGQGLVEYALILSLVSIASIVVLGLVGTDVGDVLDTVENALDGDDG